MAWIILECVSLNPRSTLAGSLASGTVLEARGNSKLIHGKHNRESIDAGPSGWAASPRDQLVPQDHVIRAEHRAWPLWPSCFLLAPSELRQTCLSHTFPRSMLSTARGSHQKSTPAACLNLCELSEPLSFLLYKTPSFKWS